MKSTSEWQVRINDEVLTGLSKKEALKFIDNPKCCEVRKVTWKQVKFNDGTPVPMTEECERTEEIYWERKSKKCIKCKKNDVAHKRLLCCSECYEQYDNNKKWEDFKKIL